MWQEDMTEPSAKTDEINRRHRRIIVGLIVLLHVGLCMWGAYVHSPTVDEPGYLASGLSHWQFGRFDNFRVSPPLVRLIAAVPVMLAQPKYDWRGYRIGPGIRAEASVGYDFLAANGERSFWLFTLGRWACIPFSLIGAWVCYRWAREMFGQASGYAALLLWCFSPNILAHAQQLTPDIGVTALCSAACYVFWRWTTHPTWKGAVVWGAVLGLALLAKTNAIVLYTAFPIIILLNALICKQRSDIHLVKQLLLGFVVSVYVLNLGYGFEGTGRPLGEFEFFSSTFKGTTETNRFEPTILSSLPLPMPAAFLEGIDLQRRDFENSTGAMKTYLRGEWYDHGWWWYYFYVIAVKVPVGTLVLCLCASILVCRQPSRRAFLLFAGIPGALLFALPCSQTGFGHSLRYILPAAPFAFLLASAMFSNPAFGKQFVISVLILLTTIGSSLRAYPHSLSYFNELAGGPENGHNHLLDGNMDWGQDFLFIRDWLEKNPSQQPVYVAYWGFLPRKEFEGDFIFPTTSSDEPLPVGTYLISVNFLHGEYRQKHPELETLRDRKQIGLISPAIRIVRIYAADR